MNYTLPDVRIDGWMNDSELEWLYNTAKEMSSIVEIGSWCGRSTHALLSGCVNGKVYAVDTFKGSLSEIDSVHARAKTDDIYAEFMRNVGHFPNLIPMRMTSTDAAAFFDDRSIDMVWIDGDHAYAQFDNDLKLWFPKYIKMFCGHDRGQGGVPKALHDNGIGIIEGPGSIWIYSPNIPIREYDLTRDGIATIIPPPASSMTIG